MAPPCPRVIASTFGALCPVSRGVLWSCLVLAPLASSSVSAFVAEGHDWSAIWAWNGGGAADAREFVACCGWLGCGVHGRRGRVLLRRRGLGEDAEASAFTANLHAVAAGSCACACGR